MASVAASVMSMCSAPPQVGPPQEASCIRLRDWAEGNYLSADKDDPAIGMSRGEILIGGPTVRQEA